MSERGVRVGGVIEFDGVAAELSVNEACVHALRHLRDRLRRDAPEKFIGDGGHGNRPPFQIIHDLHDTTRSIDLRYPIRRFNELKMGWYRAHGETSASPDFAPV